MSQGDYEAPTREEQPPASTPADDFPGPDAPVQDFPAPMFSDIDPVPVFDVTPAKEPELIRWSSERATIDEFTAVQIAGGRKNRTRMVLTNEGPEAVYLGPNMQVGVGFSFSLFGPVNQLELFTNEEVWARCAPGETAVIGIIQEYAVELDNAVPTD